MLLDEPADFITLAQLKEYLRRADNVVRDRTYELVDRIAAELAADPTLGGVALTTRISTDALAQEQTTRGAVAVVRFTIHVEAFTRAA